ncbi:esterase-like activity of phytase family protein [Microbulbifer hainanensis]|uniref:esterase-like activity of phytase family protein n=1 Tax=Microbulbifer hainanensis TaxID=2735675 RepID=UPI001868FB0B|nr:esterase-like activity of phytase family protein [Microbulbifer hainanensis]
MRYLLTLFVSLALPASAAVPVIPANLLASYWLDGSPGLDISGLSFCDGELLAVSDKDSANLYAIRFDKDSARVEPRALPAGLEIPEAENEALEARLLNLVQSAPAADFEGISCDRDGIFLVSERHHRIASIQPPDSSWMPQRWAKSARERGFMQKFNGASEGLLKVGDDFWIAMERDRRGLVHFSGDDTAPQLFEIPPVDGLDFRHRSKDLTGLAFYDGDLFTLERNAFAVCRRSLTDLQAKWCIDYRDIEMAPQFVYRETFFGKGEGLAVDASGIYVVLDNNNVARQADPQDRRGLLLHLGFPAGESLSNAPL